MRTNVFVFDFAWSDHSWNIYILHISYHIYAYARVPLNNSMYNLIHCSFGRSFRRLRTNWTNRTAQQCEYRRKQVQARACRTRYRKNREKCVFLCLMWAFIWKCFIRSFIYQMKIIIFSSGDDLWQFECIYVLLSMIFRKKIIKISK